MATVALTPEAHADLDRLATFLHETAPDDAERVMREVLVGLKALVVHPLIGRPGSAGLRELVLSVGKRGDVALYRYVENRDTVLILRVRHQREAGYRSL